MIRCTRVHAISVCLFALTFFLPLGCNSSSGQGSGTTISGPIHILPEYQSRAPRTCSPVTSPPSTATATVLVQCTMEAMSDLGVGLVQDVKIEVGKPRPFDNWGDLGLASIDHTAPVYPIQGDYNAYLCRLISNMAPAGNSCVRTVITGAQGRCWKDSFGKWHCRLQGGQALMGSGPAPQTF